MSVTRRYFYATRNFALPIKMPAWRSRACNYRGCESQNWSSTRELSANFRSLRRCSSVRASRWNTLSRTGWGGRRAERRRALLATKTHKNLKTFPTGVCPIPVYIQPRYCKKFPLCLRDRRTVFASRWEMYLHNVLTPQTCDLFLGKYTRRAGYLTIGISSILKTIDIHCDCTVIIIIWKINLNGRLNWKNC